MDQSKTPVRVIAIAAVVLIGGGAIAYALMGKKTEVTQNPSPVTSQTTGTQDTSGTPASQASAPATSASTYKDGTYSATGSYMSPGGNEQIGVTVTLKNDVITSASVTPKPVSEDGARFQDIFASNFKQYVIGKDISSVKLTTVSGSSLTPGGFNDALAQIEAKAKS